MERKRRQLMNFRYNWGDKPTEKPHMALQPIEDRSIHRGPERDGLAQPHSLNAPQPPFTPGESPLNPTPTMTDNSRVAPPPPRQPWISTKDWNLETLVGSGRRFLKVPRISAATSTVDQVLLAIQQHDQSGIPLIVEGWHERDDWPNEKFNVEWLLEHGEQTVKTRNVHDRTEKSMPLQDFIATSRSKSAFATAEEVERLYGKDAECPDEWASWVERGDTIPSVLLRHGSTDHMKYLPEPERVETLMCYLGIGDTFTPCHKDLCASSGQNLMCYTEAGGSSFWLMTASSAAPAVADFFHSLGQELDLEAHVLSVEELAKADFDVYIAEQKLGDLVLVPPRSCHQVVNNGGITIKTSWSRMTLAGLATALYHELPVYQRVCRAETYRVKSTIYNSLKHYTSELEKALPSPSSSRSPSIESGYAFGPPTSRLPVSSSRDSPLVPYESTPNPEPQVSPLQQMVEDLRQLLRLFDGILLEEYSTMHDSLPLIIPSDDSFESTEHCTCDFCGADIFQSLFECRACATLEEDSASDKPSPIAVGDGVHICSSCYIDGRTCKCTSMEPTQCRLFGVLLQNRNRAAEILIALHQEFKFNPPAIIHEDSIVPKTGSESLTMFDIACTLHRIRSTHLRSTEKSDKRPTIRACTVRFKSESWSHQVPHVSVMPCKQCHYGTCYQHILENQKMHAAEVILHRRGDDDEQFEWHKVHRTSKECFEHIRKGAEEAEKTGGYSRPEVRLALYALKFTSCQPINEAVTSLGWYDQPPAPTIEAPPVTAVDVEEKVDSEPPIDVLDVLDSPLTAVDSSPSATDQLDDFDDAMQNDMANAAETQISDHVQTSLVSQIFEEDIPPSPSQRSSPASTTPEPSAERMRTETPRPKKLMTCEVVISPPEWFKNWKKRERSVVVEVPRKRSKAIPLGTKRRIGDEEDSGSEESSSESGSSDGDKEFRPEGNPLRNVPVKRGPPRLNRTVSAPSALSRSARPTPLRRKGELAMQIPIVALTKRAQMESPDGGRRMKKLRVEAASDRNNEKASQTTVEPLKRNVPQQDAYRTEPAVVNILTRRYSNLQKPAPLHRNSFDHGAGQIHEDDRESDLLSLSSVKQGPPGPARSSIPKRTPVASSSKLPAPAAVQSQQSIRRTLTTDHSAMPRATIPTLRKRSPDVVSNGKSKSPVPSLSDSQDDILDAIPVRLAASPAPTTGTSAEVIKEMVQRIAEDKVKLVREELVTMRRLMTQGTVPRSDFEAEKKRLNELEKKLHDQTRVLEDLHKESRVDKELIQVLEGKITAINAEMDASRLALSTVGHWISEQWGKLTQLENADQQRASRDFQTRFPIPSQIIFQTNSSPGDTLRELFSQNLPAIEQYGTNAGQSRNFKQYNNNRCFNQPPGMAGPSRFTRQQDAYRTPHHTYRNANKMNANGPESPHARQPLMRGYHSFQGQSSTYAPRGGRPSFGMSGHTWESNRGLPQHQGNGYKEEAMISQDPRKILERPRNMQRSRSVPATSRDHVVEDHSSDDDGTRSPLPDPDQRRTRPPREGPVIYEREASSPTHPDSLKAKSVTQITDVSRDDDRSQSWEDDYEEQVSEAAAPNSARVVSEGNDSRNRPEKSTPMADHLTTNPWISTST